MKLLALFVVVVAVHMLDAKINKEGKLWAVLVAGSNGFYNYRHQADVCHAYQLLHRHGIPDERIIVMMYDDIADSEENKFPGKVFNHPNGLDVYHDVPKDYTGELVTPENFMKVLLGKVPKGGSGKTLKSGPNDHVFINFADHGAPGLIAFPSGELSAKQLLRTLHKMTAKKMYNRMVLYVEACESGSMFSKKLPKNTNIFATTAANTHESSYACYYNDTLETYLGDVYSVKWMEDSDKEKLGIESLQAQFTRVKAETNTSHVMEYGDMDWTSEPVGDFQGDKESVQLIYPKVPYDAVPSPDVPLEILKRKLEASKGLAEHGKYLKQIRRIEKQRDLVDQFFTHLAARVTVSKGQIERILNSRHELVHTECHHQVVKYFSLFCRDFSNNPYFLRHVQKLVNMCEEGLTVARITNTIDSVCSELPEIYNIL